MRCFLSNTIEKAGRFSFDKWISGNSISIRNPYEPQASTGPYQRSDAQATHDRSSDVISGPVLLVNPPRCEEHILDVMELRSDPVDRANVLGQQTSKYSFDLEDIHYESC